MSEEGIISDSKKRRIKIIEAGRVAVDELISIAKEKILNNNEEDLSADKLKNAAATKKMAIFDAFDIMDRIEEEEDNLKSENKKDSDKKIDDSGGFSERFAK